MNEPQELQYKVTLYPHPVLRRRAAEVEDFDDELASIVRAMLACMYASSGVGLAAPQVGIPKRILVCNPTGNVEEREDELALVNPTLTDKSGSPVLGEEGCLSFPDVYAEITRPDQCTVEAFSPEGRKIERSFEGFPSRVLQHEYDHLEGVLLVDRMSGADKQRNRGALQDLVDQYKRMVAAGA